VELYALCAANGDNYGLYRYNAFNNLEPIPLNIDESCDDDVNAISFRSLSRGPILGSFFLIDTEGNAYFSTESDGDRLTTCLPIPDNKRILVSQWAGASCFNSLVEKFSANTYNSCVM
jgi:hypothetical protein